MIIKDIKTKMIQNSRNEDTIEIEVSFDNGISEKASVPQGKSTGEKEVLALPAVEAIEAIEAISSNLKKEEFKTQEEFDKFLIDLDGTENKSRLGANTILALSLSFARAKSQEQKLELYQYIAKLAKTEPRRPCFYLNMIEGGKHAKNNLDWQEYLLVVSESSAENSLKIGKKVFEKLGKILRKAEKEINYSDEGSYDTNFKDNQEPLEFINRAIQTLGYQDKTKLALDVAANSFSQQDGVYYTIRGSRTSPSQLTNIYKDVVNKYPIISIEDPFDENQMKDYATLNQFLEMKNGFIVGDDLTVTNSKLIKIALNSIGGVIIKPNQIGTLTEAVEAIKIVKEAGLKIIVSHRSGETMDDFIADLAYGVGAFGFKSGAPGPKERMVKYNRIIAIDGGLK